MTLITLDFYSSYLNVVLLTTNIELAFTLFSFAKIIYCAYFCHLLFFIFEYGSLVLLIKKKRVEKLYPDFVLLNI